MSDRNLEADRIHRYRGENAGEEQISVFSRAILGDDNKASLETAADGSLVLSRSQTTIADKDGNFLLVGPTNDPRLAATISLSGLVVGDGVTDDTNAILTASAACPVGGTILGVPGATYKLSNQLVFTKNLTVDFQGATLLATNGAYPNNNHIRIQSNVSAAVGSWVETVTKGQTTYNVAVPPATLPVGTLCRLSLGEDPYDPNQENCVLLTKVVANTGSAVTFDTPCPFNIHNANTGGHQTHLIQPIPAPVDSFILKNVRFGSTVVVNANVSVDCARNVVMENLGGTFTLGICVSNSANVIVRNLDATLDLAHPAAGKLLNAWQSENILFENCKVQCNANVVNPVVFLESWNRGVVFRNLHISWNQPAINTYGLFHSVGGSYNARVEDLTVDNPYAVPLVSLASPAHTVSFGRVVFNGPCNSLQLQDVDDLIYQGVHYQQKTLVRRSFSSLAANAQYSFHFGRGPRAASLRLYA